MRVKAGTAYLRGVALITATVMILETGCAEKTITGPRIRILGTVQDGGLPHAACWCPQSQAARTSPARRRFVSSLALILPQSSAHPLLYLFDATPDIRSQLDLLHDVCAGVANGIDRSPVDGVFLTHAHIGHYLGLAFFGYEALHTSNLPVFCTPRMAEFLRTNGPWSQLVRIGNVQLQTLEPGRPVRVPLDAAAGDSVMITPVLVPHRDEYSDTVGFIIRREPAEPNKAVPAVLFVPDTDSWEKWNPSLLTVIEKHEVSVAILDGTFYSPDELPDRGAGKIGHPLMKDTMDLLEPMVRAGCLKVYFMHLNHSNPALDPSSPALQEITRRGFRIAREGMELAL